MVLKWNGLPAKTYICYRRRAVKEQLICNTERHPLEIVVDYWKLFRVNSYYLQKRILQKGPLKQLSFIKSYYFFSFLKHLSFIENHALQI